MNQIIKFIRELTAEADSYGGEIAFEKGSYDTAALSLVPDALKAFYTDYAHMSLPFGDIYPIEYAVEQSMREPYQSEGWFCFGFDRYFTFWLCRITPDEENLSFTAWDHDVGEIGGAVDQSIMDFLQRKHQEFIENRNPGSVMLDELPENTMEFLEAIKEAFSLTIPTCDLLEEVEDLPYEVAENIPYNDAMIMMEETGHEECFSFLSNESMGI